MSEDKSQNVSEEASLEKKEPASEEKLVSVKDEVVDVDLGIEKDISGLEQLPEDIIKKLEKKKAENEQKNKKTKLRKKKKKVAKRVPVGKAYIKSSYNNTVVTLTDPQGAVISWASAGMAGFKGAKKATPYAAQIITRIAVGKARQEFGLSEVSVFVRGVGTGRESAVRSLNNNGLIVTSIQDVTPKPHNGCRARKPRRV
jgi:small subunit ribosomal protein S11